jgi:arylsulfatase A-like enzyme
VILAGLVLAHALALAPRAPQDLDVLVMVADDLGWPEWEHLQSIQDLAARGTTFTRFYTYPTCSPARYALLAGRMGRRQPTLVVDGSAIVPQPGGVADLVFNAHDPQKERLPLHAGFVQELLAPSYSTCLVGKWHLGRAPLTGAMELVQTGPLEQGFEFWEAGSPVVLNAGAPQATGYKRWWRVTFGDLAIETQWATHVQRDRFLDWWSRTDLEQPKFCVLSWSAPHDPFDTPPGMFPATGARNRYLQLVQDLDDAMFEVLAAVDLTRTVVVFLADNGTPDHQLNSARPPGTPAGRWKGSLYEGGINVPLVIAGPGVHAGLVSQRLVASTDLAATLCELVGVALPKRGGFEDSVSFADALGAHAGRPARTWLAVERYRVPAALAYPQPEGYDGVAVVESEWKLVRHDPDGIGPRGFETAMYHLPSDPLEVAPVGSPPYAGAAGLQMAGAWKRMNHQMGRLPGRVR